jgi:hypothetical protein
MRISGLHFELSLWSQGREYILVGRDLETTDWRQGHQLADCSINSSDRQWLLKPNKCQNKDLWMEF